MPWGPHQQDKDDVVVDHSTKLQWIKDKIDDHDEKFKAGNERFAKQEKLSEGILSSLNTINDNLKAAKWALLGGVIVFCLNQFGVFAIMKAWFHGV